MTTINLYETDIYAWALHNAQLLREKRIDELDFEHVAEEIESMGASQKRELQSRLEVLIVHLLKLDYLDFLRVQNERGWKLTIKEQRKRISQCLRDSPSLKSTLTTCFDDAFSYSVDTVVRHTGVDEKILPVACPYTLEQVLNEDFYP